MQSLALREHGGPVTQFGLRFNLADDDVRFDHPTPEIIYHTEAEH